MSYSDIKITQADINENNVRSASDILIGNADDNKAVFDKLPEFIAGKHNDLVDALDEVSEHAQGDTEEIDRLSAEKVNVPKNGTELDFGEAGQMLTTKGNGETQWEDAGQPTDEQTQNAINNWLDAHPEATTTVEDESLTYKKLVKGTLGYVTPEMFGAKGDGVTDDTQAWQSAVDFGLPVKATRKKYKCGQINVTKNITIDCNGAEFTCVDNCLFFCTGTVVKTLQNESDYTANQTDYSISDNEYNNYTGLAMLKGTNNFELAREYYIGGFVCEFYEGTITTPYPIDVSDVSLEIIKPIMLSISNVGDIIRSSGSLDTQRIFVKYGYNCKIDNSVINDSGGYGVIVFDSCFNCSVERSSITNKSLGGVPYSYTVALLNSSFCSVRDCYINNNDWHCITTGDSYLCYHNVVDNCALYSDVQFAFADHENALNTIVTNSVCTGIVIGGMGVVDNCNIVSVGGTYQTCLIRISPTSEKNNAVYTLRNIKFLPAASANSSYVGVWLASSPQTNGHNYYYTDCVLDNLMVENGVVGFMTFSLPTTSNYAVENIMISKTNLNVRLGRLSNETNIDISNYTLAVKDCHVKNKRDNRFIVIGNTNLVFNNIFMENVEVHDFLGTATNVVLNNFKSTQVMTGNVISGKLRGTGVHSRILADVLLGCSEINITDLYNTANVTWMNVSRSNDSKVYYQRYIGNKVEVYEVTA